MKKLIAIFLLVCLIAPFAGTYIWLKHELKITRKELKKQLIEGLDNRDLVTLKFVKYRIKCELKFEHPKEFEYHGEMYDVVKSETKGDTIIYNCWWDNKETKLNKQLAHLMDDILGSNPQNKENQKRLVNFYKSLFYKNIDNLISNTPSFTSNSYYSFYNFISGLNCPLPPVPPPEKA